MADKDAHHRHGCFVSPQETGIPEELLVTVVRPGLPTLADLHVLLPPPRPTRKRSLVSDKVSPAATRPGASCPTEGLVADHSHRNPRGPLSRKASFLASQSDAGAGPLPCVTTPSGTHVAFEVPMVGGGWGQAHLPGVDTRHFLSHFTS